MAPTCWRQHNGMMQNIPASEQAAALERGGGVYLDFSDPDNPKIVIYPWQDGSTDALYMSAVGLEYDGPMVENGYGWKVPLKNHIYGATFLQLLDLQSVKVPDALENFLGNGVALLYVGMPVAGIPQGEWVPKRIAFSGMVDDCTFTIQPDERSDPDVDQPDWVPYSIVISHNDKQNSGGHRKYTTGKIGHLPRPIAIGRKNGDITGWAYGEWREVSHGVFDKVFFRDAQFDADMTRRSIGNPQTIAVSADLGYTDVGATLTNLNTSETVLGTIGVAPGNGDVTSHFIFYPVNHTGTRFTALYTEGGGTYPDTPAGGTLLGESTALSSLPSWREYSVNHTITNGDELWLMTQQFNGATTGLSLMRDTTGVGSSGKRDIGAEAVTSAPDPYASVGSLDALNEFKFSMYIEYTPAAATPITTNVTTVPSTIPKGTDIEITATIADGDNPTTKWEWYIGVDPGEGAGNEESMPGGSSPWSVSVTGIDSSGLPYGSNSFSVRGFSSDGWGAVDTAISVVNYAAPENLSGVGADESVVLEWDATDDADDYFITWGTAVDGGTGLPTGGGIINVGDVLTYTHTGRVNGTTYYYAVAGNKGIHGGTYSPAIAVVAGVPTTGDTSGLNLGIGLEL